MFFRAALAILKLSEPTLLQLDLESIMTYLSRFPNGGEWVLEKENLVPAALSIKVRVFQRKFLLNSYSISAVRPAWGVVVPEGTVRETHPSLKCLSSGFVCISRRFLGVPCFGCFRWL